MLNTYRALEERAYAAGAPVDIKQQSNPIRPLRVEDINYKALTKRAAEL